MPVQYPFGCKIHIKSCTLKKGLCSEYTEMDMRVTRRGGGVSPGRCCSSHRMIQRTSRARNCSSMAARPRHRPARRSIAGRFRKMSIGPRNSKTNSAGRRIGARTYFRKSRKFIEPSSGSTDSFQGSGFFDQKHWSDCYAESRAWFCVDPCTLGSDRGFIREVRRPPAGFDRPVLRNRPPGFACRHTLRRAGGLVLGRRFLAAHGSRRAALPRSSPRGLQREKPHPEEAAARPSRRVGHDR
jgi:hypothetical protein